MRFTVEWRPAAEDALADIWLKAANRAAIRAATLDVDRELSRDPETKGSEFYGDLLLVAGPLHVVYQVPPEDRRVIVLHVWSV